MLALATVFLIESGGTSETAKAAECSVRIQVSPEHEVDHLLCTANNTQIEDLESSLRSYLVEQKVLEDDASSTPSAVRSRWFQMENIVTSFKRFLRTRKSLSDTFVIIKPENIQRHAPEPSGAEENPSSTQKRSSQQLHQEIEENLQQLLLGRPEGDTSKLLFVDAFIENDGFYSVLFRHEEGQAKAEESYDRNLVRLCFSSVNMDQESFPLLTFAVFDRPIRQWSGEEVA